MIRRAALVLLRMSLLTIWIAVTTMWLRSLRVSDGAGYRPDAWAWEVESAQGCLAVSRLYYPAEFPAYSGWILTFGHGPPISWRIMGTATVSGLGFRWFASSPGIISVRYMLVVPYWFIWLVATAMQLFWVIPARARLRRRRRATAGLCIFCGYDLRATGERCPECGHPVSKDVNVGGTTQSSSSCAAVIAAFAKGALIPVLVMVCYDIAAGESHDGWLLLLFAFFAVVLAIVGAGVLFVTLRTRNRRSAARCRPLPRVQTACAGAAGMTAILAGALGLLWISRGPYEAFMVLCLACPASALLPILTVFVIGRKRKQDMLSTTGTAMPTITRPDSLLAATRSDVFSGNQRAD